MRNFQARSESLTTLREGVLFGERLVIPGSLSRKCLHQLQSAPVAWPISTVPWERVHVDYAGPIDGTNYPVLIDSCSKWPEVEQTTTITSLATIRILRGLFARLGMPNALISDSGTPFVSAEFEEFCTRNGIEHIRTPPYHPQSNGRAARFVDTLKRGLKKISEGRRYTQEALDLLLLTYRSTRNSQIENGKSPAEIMFVRRIRTCLELLRAYPTITPVTDDAKSRRRKLVIWCMRRNIDMVNGDGFLASLEDA